MPHRRLLFLDTLRLSAYLWSNGRLHEEATFANTPLGHESFAEYLAKTGDSNFHLLVDVADEGFQIEHIPHSQGGDRTALIKRRLGQYYYGTPYSTSISFGREKEGRRDEKVLLAALTRPEHLTPWIDALAAVEASVAGIYSVPLVLADWGSRLMANKTQYLLLTPSSGGLRQTFFDHGQMLFSRLSLLATGGRNEVAVAAAAESQKIYQYLVGQRLVARGASLTAVILAPSDQIAELQSHCQSNDQLDYEFIDLVQTAKKSGLRSLPGDHADALLMHRLIAKSPGQQFAPPELRRYFRFWQLRFGLNSAAALVLGACLLFAGKLVLDSTELSSGTAAAIASAEQINQRYTAALDTLPKIPLSNETLRALTGRFEQLEKRSPGMHPSLVELSRVLDAHPRIEITRIDWRIDSTLESASGGNPPPPAAGADAPAYSIITLDAELPARIANDLRAQQESIEQFASDLKKLGLEVRMLRLPFDATSAQTLKSSTDAPAAQLQAPKFSLRMARKL